MLLHDDQVPDTDAISALLATPSVADCADALRDAVCAATPSYAPGVAADMALIASCERSVSAAGLELSRGERLGTFTGSTGVFARTRRLAAATFGSDEAVLLVNGSTQGNQIVAKLLAARGATVLFPANAHHSTVLALTDEDVEVFRMPLEYDARFEASHVPSPGAVAALLTLHPEIDTVLLTSPSYEGECADIAAIAEVCRRHRALLVVDSAWGAHFPHHEELPAPPTMLGADIAITSLHKLGGGPQQTALLLYNEQCVTHEEVDTAYLRCATTSPSMVLLGGIDSALRTMATKGRSHIGRTLGMGDELAILVRDLPGVEVFTPPAGIPHDRTRITIRAGAHSISGFELAEELERRRIACEKASSQAVTFLMAMGLPNDAPVRIAAAIAEILASRPARRAVSSLPNNPFAGMSAAPALTPGVAQRLGRVRGERVGLQDAVGRVACELYEVYPPGIPVVIPGFRVTPGAVDVLVAARDHVGGHVVSTTTYDGRLRVLSGHQLPTTTSGRND
jgi:arginine decarboxylase